MDHDSTGRSTDDHLCLYDTGPDPDILSPDSFLCFQKGVLYGRNKDFNR